MFFPLPQLASKKLLWLMKNTSNTLPSSNKWLVSSATDEALRETEFVAAVPAVMDAVSAPLAENVTTNHWFISLHQTVDPMVYLVRVDKAVAAERIQHNVHVTVVWCQVMLQAIPQVQVLDSMQVHVVETVTVVPQDREPR